MTAAPAVVTVTAVTVVTAVAAVTVAAVAVVRETGVARGAVAGVGSVVAVPLTPAAGAVILTAGGTRVVCSPSGAAAPAPSVDQDPEPVA